MILLIIYLCLLALLTIWGLVSAIICYITPSGHEKFPWYYNFYAGLLTGLFSPIMLFIMIIGCVSDFMDKKKNK